MKMNLHRSHEIGRIVNVNGGAYRIIGETGVKFDCLPGGRGVREVVLEQVANRTLTVGEIAKL